MTKASVPFAESTSPGPPDLLWSPRPVTRWRDVFRDAQKLDVEAWHETLRPAWGRYSPAVSDPTTYVAKIRPQSLYGFSAMHLMPNAVSIERTQRDARIDGMDHYYALFSVEGTVTVVQNDQPVELASGHAVLVDSARSVSYVDPNDQRQPTTMTDVDGDGYRQCFVLQLPRQSLVTHLGFEPQFGRGVRFSTSAGKLLFQLVHDALDDGEAMSEPTAGYMSLAMLDLVGAIFSPPDPATFSRTDKLFSRVCNIAKNRFADPDISPDAMAAEAGISRRYLQKLFSMRNLTYTHFINSLRLDHAAQLLQRRALLNTMQPISAIAIACGFGDYANFARQFRNRFGHAPGAHARNRD